MSQAEFPMDHNIVHVFYKYYSFRGCPGGSMVKNLTANTGDADKLSNPGLERSPGWREWRPTPIFLPGEIHGQSSWVGWSPQDHKRVRHKQLNNNKALSCSGCVLGRCLQSSSAPPGEGLPLTITGWVISNRICSPWQKILGQGTDSTCVSEGPEVFIEM